MMKPTLSEDRITWENDLGSEIGKVMFIANELRRERTGFHGKLGIFYQGQLLAHDTFNIGRNEERRRLCKAAYEHLSPLVRESYILGQLNHDLDMFCLQTPDIWEGRFEPEFLDGSAMPPIEWALKDYILASGGTILFAPPGAGKSWTALLMAVSIATGCTGEDREDPLWDGVSQRTVLYVNLERSRSSLERRSTMAHRVLGFRKESVSPVSYINARGSSIMEVRKSIKTFVDSHAPCTVFIDSLSRMGTGSLVDDEDANRGADILNSLADSWVALGHTPKNDKASTAVFGSQMWTAAEDIGVKLTSQELNGALGVCLTVIKANDTAKPKPLYLSFTFQNDVLQTVIKASETDFPELAQGKPVPQAILLRDWMRQAGSATTTQAARATGMKVQNVSDAFLHSGLYLVHSKAGREVYYKLTASAFSTKKEPS